MSSEKVTLFMLSRSHFYFLLIYPLVTPSAMADSGSKRSRAAEQSRPAAPITDRGIRAPSTKRPAKDRVSSKEVEQASSITTKKTDRAKEKQAQASIDSLVSAIERRYISTNSATFDFEQSYQHPFLKTNEVSKGQVSFKKAGGKILWSYLEPKDRQKKFYINGDKLTYYSIKDKLAYVHNCYDKDALSASVAFLMGMGSLNKAFAITMLTSHDKNPALKWLSLVPKEKNPPFKTLLLGVGSGGMVMESIVIDQSGGKNHFKFKGYKANSKIPDSTFVFTPEKGVMVQPMPNVTCKTTTPPEKTPLKKPAASKDQTKSASPKNK